MKNIVISIFLVCLFSQMMLFGQISDSLEIAMMEKINSSDILKEDIYALKGKELPKFDLRLIDGKILSSEDLRGKPTLINFWFTNCAPCIAEIPTLNRIKHDFENDVNFLAITFEDQEEIKTFPEFKLQMQLWLIN